MMTVTTTVTLKSRWWVMPLLFVMELLAWFGLLHFDLDYPVATFIARHGFKVIPVPSQK